MIRRLKRRKPLSKFAAGAIAIVAIVVFSYLGFTRFALPFSSKYTVHVIFSNSNGLRPTSLVRIAGVNVGKVQSVGPVAGCKVAGQVQSQCSASDVQLQIDNMGLPIHKDATFYIRPRIFLEGNFFVDVRPGSPEAPTAPSGYVFPIQQGVEPVQFDQVLSSLQADTRGNLQTLLEQYGIAVKQGGPSYNSSIKYWQPAYQYSSESAHDALGLQPHDLSNWIAQQGTVAGAFDAHPQNLQNLVTDFNTTAEAFARQNVALARAVNELPRTLAAATPAFNSLNAAFPPTREFARAFLPGVQSTGPMIDASLPFISQLNALVQPSELQGLTKDLSVTVPALAQLTAETIPFMKNGVRPFSSCVANVIIPWSQLTLHDPHFNSSNGFPPRKVYVEGVNFLPGLAGESRDFDANGPYVRILGTGGPFTSSLSLPGQTPMFGQSLFPMQGVQPKLPPKHFANGSKVPVYRPPLEPNVPCETQPAITNLSAPTGGAPPQRGPGSGLPLGLASNQAMLKRAIPALKQMAQQQGLKFQLSNKLPGK